MDRFVAGTTVKLQRAYRSLVGVKVDTAGLVSALQLPEVNDDPFPS